MAKNRAKKFALGAAVAAVAGFIAGMLTAPKSGRETRKDISDRAKKFSSDAKTELENAHDELIEFLDNLNSVKEDINKNGSVEYKDILNRANGIKSQAGKLLNALKSGKANDKELRQLADDAKNVLAELKNYLAK